MQDIVIIAHMFCLRQGVWFSLQFSGHLHANGMSKRGPLLSCTRGAANNYGRSGKLGADVIFLACAYEFGN